VVLLHLHYPELTEEFGRRLEGLHDCDVAVTFSSLWGEAELAALARALPAARLFPVENRGRDLAPFLDSLRWAQQAGYDLFCKLHSKRSPHTSGGDRWRDELVSGLLGGDRPARALAAFAAERRLGLVAPAGARMRLGEHGVMHNNQEAVGRLARLLGFAWSDDTPFPAGSMFWGRAAAFAPLTALTAEQLAVRAGDGAHRRDAGARAGAFPRRRRRRRRLRSAFHAITRRKGLSP
jgi:lipopolysaccharide biosynthesis protein